MISNIEKTNKEHYEKFYKSLHKKGSFKFDKQKFLTKTVLTDTSWYSFYYNEFYKELNNKRVLELGCGKGFNAVTMAKFGAKVFANDIADECGNIIANLNESNNLKENAIQFVSGNFLDINFDENSFDFIVGKAFVHHLTNDLEKEFYKKIAKILKKDGKVRFSEPCVNNKFLDEFRWMIPTKSRPSKLSRKVFDKWKENDPHPLRDNSSKSFEKLGKLYFNKVKITPQSSLERIAVILPLSHKRKRKARAYALKLEKYMPRFLQYYFSRIQTIEFSDPK